MGLILTDSYLRHQEKYYTVVEKCLGRMHLSIRIECTPVDKLMNDTRTYTAQQPFG